MDKALSKSRYSSMKELLKFCKKNCRAVRISNSEKNCTTVFLKENLRENLNLAIFLQVYRIAKIFFAAQIVIQFFSTEL